MKVSMPVGDLPQLPFNCLKSAIELLKKRCGICSKLTIKTPE